MAKPTATEIHHEQMTIEGIDLDYPLKTHACSRPVIGDLMEEIAVDIFGGDRLRVHSGKTCPDIKLVDNKYLEIKAVGAGKSSHLFKSRVDKYKEWMFENETDLSYVYLFHSAQWAEGETRDSLRKKVYDTLSACFIIDAHKMHDVVESLPAKKFNIKGRPELSDGWHIPSTVFLTLFAVSEKSVIHGNAALSKHINHPVKKGMIT